MDAGMAEQHREHQLMDARMAEGGGKPRPYYDTKAIRSDG
jgi:hypothetical protein